MQKADQDQEALRRLVRNHDQFSEEEKRALHIESVSAFNASFDAAIDARDEWEASRNHGVGQVIQTTQNVLVSSYVILQHLEPMVELVRHLGAPYGGMAIGTLSFLFVVCVKTIYN